ncbi:uncharacterized protein LOC110815615 isoform X2 [Carica papaya]|uniref:uncharacterized protein LOC110815615 isoform X2 n=1 Tax=Carica papaya TaxID=3649 RepID=UPI000B8CAE15|nr:uncharacterized protein LOC110815615 isoform X2 [Carica papaya]
MVHSYTPTYYSTLHDSITSLCKTILPFSLKKRRLPAAEHRLAKMQSDNLKWQQDSFHQILNLMGLHKEGILAEAEVAAFRSHLLEKLIASPAEQEQQVILKDKLVFLQDLLYAKCISEEEYHCSKRPLLQRLAVQGAEIEVRDVVVAGPKPNQKENSDEEWSEIDLKDENTHIINKENSHSKNKSKHSSAMKQIKGAASVFSFVTSHKPGKNRAEQSIFDIESKRSASSKNETVCVGENPFDKSNKESQKKLILMQEAVQIGSSEKTKRKPFRTLFNKEQSDGQGGCGGTGNEEKTQRSGKKQWRFDGFRRRNRNDSEEETTPLPLDERSDSEAYFESCKLVSSPIGEGPDTKLIKRKLHAEGSAPDFFIDKVLGEKIKKELSRIQTELNATNPNLKFSNDQIEAISTKLPVDKADLNKFFPKSWCDRYGEVVLDVVKKEFKEHVGEMESMRNAAREKQNGSSMRWTTFEEDDDDENCHPNLFAAHHHDYDHSSSTKQPRFSSTPWNEDSASNYHGHGRTGRSFGYNNPFFHDYSRENQEQQNPFWVTP